jgi:hypothetical protein
MYVNSFHVPCICFPMSMQLCSDQVPIESISCETTSLLKLDASNKSVGPPDATSPWEFKL